MNHVKLAMGLPLLAVHFKLTASPSLRLSPDVIGDRNFNSGGDGAPGNTRGRVR